jgi:hypothetical protein
MEHIKQKILPFLYRVQQGPGAHPVSYLIDGTYLNVGKAADSRSSSLISREYVELCLHFHIRFKARCFKFSTGMSLQFSFCIFRCMNFRKHLKK